VIDSVNNFYEKPLSKRENISPIALGDGRGEGNLGVATFTKE
jgi:hypothetical protein